MADEMKGKDGEAQVSVNGEQLHNLSEEQVKELVESITKDVKKTLESMNESMRSMLNNISFNRESVSSMDVSNLLKKLPVPNSFSKLNPSNLLEKFPTVETVNENGRLQILLGKKKLFEIDLPESKKEEE